MLCRVLHRNEILRCLPSSNEKITFKSTSGVKTKQVRYSQS